MVLEWEAPALGPLGRRRVERTVWLHHSELPSPHYVGLAESLHILLLNLCLSPFPQ